MSTEDTRKSSRYLDQIVSMRDSIASFASGLNIPTARTLIITNRVKTDDQIITEFLEIKPVPIIERVSPRVIAAFNNSNSITIKIDDLQVKGISRKYPREKIIGTGISYFIDAELVNNKIQGGFECEIANVDELPLTWNLILRRKTDDRRNI